MATRKAPVSEQRIAFETWYKANNTSANLIRTGKGYVDNTARVAWRAWQAAQPAPELGLTWERFNALEAEIATLQTEWQASLTLTAVRQRTANP
jgi:hypothetical protein